MTTVQHQPLTRRADANTTHLYLAQQQTVLARSDETGGAFALIEELVQAGLEPPPHIHTREDEAFYVLDGQVDFHVGDCTHHVTGGGFIFLPRGIAHSFKLRTPTARLLVFLTPGGFERFFLEMAQPLKEGPTPPGPEDFARLLTEAPRHGIEWAGLPRD